MQVLVLNDKRLQDHIKSALPNAVLASNNAVARAKYKDHIIITDDIDSLDELNGLQVLAISKTPSTQEAKLCLEQGARGYANAKMQAVHYQDAIATIKAGGIWLSPSIVLEMIKHINIPHQASLDMLTPRENNIAQQVCSGKQNAQIAASIGVSERTIKADLSSIYQKLGVKNRIQLALYLSK